MGTNCVLEVKESKVPYYHVKCGGVIGLWTRKCKKCGKKWPIWALLGVAPPPDMKFVVSNKMKPRMPSKTFYSREAFVSRLPNWPRWLRILTVILVLIIVIFVIRWLFG